MQLEQQESPKTLDHSAVRQFLTMNPDFFNQHADVLPRLRIPHEAGGAVSLIEKQVSVLRDKCYHLETSLRDLISVARENELLHMRLHRLIQDIISADSLEQLVSVSRESLIENFKADDVRMFLTTPENANNAVESETESSNESSNEVSESSDKKFDRKSQQNYFTLSSKDPVFELFSKNFANNETFCGPLSDEQRALLCTGCETELASAAVIPLQYNGSKGLLVLGSADENRFAAGKGVMFLNQLGEVLSRRVQSFELVETPDAENIEKSTAELTDDAVCEELANV